MSKLASQIASHPSSLLASQPASGAISQPARRIMHVHKLKPIYTYMYVDAHTCIYIQYLRMDPKQFLLGYRIWGNLRLP